MGKLLLVVALRPQRNALALAPTELRGVSVMALFGPRGRAENPPHQLARFGRNAHRLVTGVGTL
jgi:hypothetical protein